ncbi:MAG: YraN family protein [Luteitalea sp.]|nr:YraN family protein [Luteitalea sp.]
MAADPRGTLGESGEILACRELVRHGYAILERRYRTRGGEIDIVAEHRRTIVFVEVKTRRTVSFGQPAEAVTWIKRRRLRAMARDYLSHRRLGDRACRFDVVTVLWPVGQRPTIEIIENAFEADAW